MNKSSSFTNLCKCIAPVLLLVIYVFNFHNEAACYLSQQRQEWFESNTMCKGHTYCHNVSYINCVRRFLIRSQWYKWLTYCLWAPLWPGQVNSQKMDRISLQGKIAVWEIILNLQMLIKLSCNIHSFKAYQMIVDTIIILAVAFSQTQGNCCY